ncbi:Clp protease N-terminal domain-containing protein [Arthrobacter sp. NA-172]|uniref:Clp protease N-terminal domain-containing protein n=1 Tax=Arthrobacter sp. NA-172 TaxID=3367524 RepID=UPI00375413B7
MNGDELPAPIPATDPAIGLRAVGALHRLAEKVEASNVALARERGWSWNRSAMRWASPGSRFTPNTESETDMFERFAGEARTAVHAGAEEAKRRGDRRIGTDHLLLGLFHDPQSRRILGTDLESARAGLDALDRESLEAVGITVDHFGPLDAPIKASRVTFTSAARSVIQDSLILTTKEKARRITTRHLLLALLERRQPDPAAVLLDHLGVDAVALKARLKSPDS